MLNFNTEEFASSEQPLLVPFKDIINLSSGDHPVFVAKVKLQIDKSQNSNKNNLCQ